MRMDYRKLFSVIMVTSVCVNFSLYAADVPSLLKQFNRSATPANANLFFATIEEDGLLDEHVVMPPASPTDSMRAAVWYWAAEYYYEVQDYVAAAQYGEQSIPLCRKYSDRKMHADCASLLGLVYVRLGDFSRAAMYAKECNGLDLASGDADNIASSYNTLAGIYMSMRQPDEAEKYILQAIEYVRRVHNPAREAVIYGMASEVYQHQNRPAKSLEYATRAWELEKQLGRPDKAAVRQTQRAASLTVLEQYAEAEECLTEAIPVLESSANYHSLAIAYNQMGDLLYVTGRNREGADYYYKALPIFLAQHDIYNEAHTRKGLRETLRGIDPEAALEHGDRFEHLRDSMYDHATNANLSQFAAEIENNILQELNRKQRVRSIITILLICLLFALAAVATYFIHRHRQKRQMEHLNRLLSEVENYRQTALAGAPGEAETETEHQTDEELETETEEKESLSEEDKLFLAKATDCIKACLPGGIITTEMVASAMHMSVSTFRRRINAITQDVPKAFIQAVQVSRAEELLAETQPYSGSISDIAAECGFREPSTFIRVFRRVTGMTPFKWRERHRNGNPPSAQSLPEEEPVT